MPGEHVSVMDALHLLEKEAAVFEGAKQLFDLELDLSSRTDLSLSERRGLMVAHRQRKGQLVSFVGELIATGQLGNSPEDVIAGFKAWEEAAKASE